MYEKLFQTAMRFYALAAQTYDTPVIALGGKGEDWRSAEDAAALSALAIGAPVTTLQPLGLPAATQPIDAQPVTSLPDGVTIVGEPVVLQR